MLSEKARRALCIEIIRLLRLEREQLGLSRYAVAQRSGLSEQMIGYVEKGLRNPSLETVIRMADALQIDLADVFKTAYGNSARQSRLERDLAKKKPHSS